MTTPTPGGPVRVALFREVDGGFDLSEREMRPLRTGEVAVRVKLCTICGSDLHTYYGRRSAPTPCVLGHEIVGEVTAVCGEPEYWNTTRRIRAGERVTWCLAVSCGACTNCGRDLPQACESLRKFGHERDGEASGLMGGLGEACILPRGTAVFPVPPELSDEAVAPANCAVATAAAAIRSTGAELAGARVVVLGAGMVGTSLCAIAKSRGANVAVVDSRPQRREQAVAFRADEAHDIDEAVKEADFVFEASGAAAAVDSSLDRLRVGGQVVLVGSVLPSPGWTIDPESLVRRHATIRGVHNYTPRDLNAAMEIMAESATSVPWHRAVGATYPLEDVQRAFVHASRGEELRIGVRPQ